MSVYDRVMAPRLTELLKPFEVDDVLGGAVGPGAYEQVGLLQDEEALFPLLGVQHVLVPQPTHALKLPRQQAVAAQRSRGLDRDRDRDRDKHRQRDRSIKTSYKQQTWKTLNIR